MSGFQGGTERQGRGKIIFFVVPLVNAEPISIWYDSWVKYDWPKKAVAANSYLSAHLSATAITINYFEDLKGERLRKRVKEIEDFYSELSPLSLAQYVDYWFDKDVSLRKSHSAFDLMDRYIYDHLRKVWK